MTGGGRGVRILGFVSVIACALGSLGAKCNRVCADCPEGMTRSCYSRCVPLVKTGEPCSTDPCADDGQCEADGTCLPPPTGSPQPICQRLDSSRLGDRCEAAGSLDLCSNDLYCRDVPGCDPGSGFDTPICASPVSEGATCDGDVSRPRITKGCSPCGSGLTCAEPSVDHGWGLDPRACHATCRTSLDCACRDGKTCSTELVLTTPPLRDLVYSGDPPPGICVNCRAFAQTCNAHQPCCDGSGCDRAHSPTADGRTCCKSRGMACSNTAECCTSQLVCAWTEGKRGLPGGLTCQQCRKPGEACIAGGGCCDHLTCTGGLCKYPCTPGATCPGDKPGACSIGATTCDPKTGAPTCVTPRPQPEQCDGKDHDCDGTPNNVAPTPCTATVAGCQAGFTWPGTRRCDGCVPNPDLACTTPGHCGLKQRYAYCCTSLSGTTFTVTSDGACTEAAARASALSKCAGSVTSGACSTTVCPGGAAPVSSNWCCCHDGFSHTGVGCTQDQADDNAKPYDCEGGWSDLGDQLACPLPECMPHSQ